MSNRPIQFISPDEKFVFSLDEHKNLQGGKVMVVFVIGQQNSGKSTLLNKLFGTEFEMLDSKRAIQRTTDGILVSKARVPPNVDCGKEILVFDVEGCDCGFVDRKSFDSKSALFALAMSSVLIINMEECVTGRHEGGMNPVLGRILQSLLKLPINQKRTLLLTIRDYEKIRSDKTRHETQLKKFKEIWESIAKPSKFAGRQFEDFFNIRTIGLPDLHVESTDPYYEAARNAVIVLRRQFFSPTGGDIFRDFRIKEYNNVEEVMTVAKDMWAKVLKDDELNVEDARVTFAKNRCLTEYNYTHTQLENGRNILIKRMEDSMGPKEKEQPVDVRTQMKALANNAKNYFSSKVSQYQTLAGVVYTNRWDAVVKDCEKCSEEVETSFKNFKEKASRNKKKNIAKGIASGVAVFAAGVACVACPFLGVVAASSSLAVCTALGSAAVVTGVAAEAGGMAVLGHIIDGHTISQSSDVPGEFQEKEGEGGGKEGSLVWDGEEGKKESGVNTPSSATTSSSSSVSSASSSSSSANGGPCFDKNEDKVVQKTHTQLAGDEGLFRTGVSGQSMLKKPIPECPVCQQRCTANEVDRVCWNCGLYYVWIEKLQKYKIGCDGLLDDNGRNACAQRAISCFFCCTCFAQLEDDGILRVCTNLHCNRKYICNGEGIFYPAVVCDNKVEKI